jgi:hypothetical protein
MTKKKSSKPELIEDTDLDQASGGIIAIAPQTTTGLKIRTTDSVAKIEIGSLKAGDGSV